MSFKVEELTFVKCHVAACGKPAEWKVFHTPPGAVAKEVEENLCTEHARNLCGNTKPELFRGEAPKR